MRSVSKNRAGLVFSLLAIASFGAPAWAEDMPFDVSTLGMSLLSNGGARSLPVVSTGSVDINIVDMPFLRSNGGQGAFPQGSYDGTGSSSSNGETGSGSSSVPALPPGYAGVMCHGIFAGAIPPGGNIEDFWRGAYGFAGDAAQQEAMMREGEWLRQNGQI